MKKIALYLFIHLIVYLFGSFIAWDINPLNWWLLSTSIGRIFFLVFEILCIVNLFDD